ncbi:MAG: hypothetical protein AB7Q42_18745 [Acidimicrobiia bacterium]
MDDVTSTMDRSPELWERPSEVTESRPSGAYGVLEAHTLHLRGTLPTWEVADLVAERLGRVIGPERVSASNKLDPAAAMPTSFPIFAKGGTGAFDEGSAHMGADLTSVLDLVHRLLAVYPAVEVSVRGHLSECTDDADGARVARERVRAVSAYLEFKGTDLRRIHGLVDDRAPEARKIELDVHHLLE